MTVSQRIITIVMVIAGTMATRFIPFLIFPKSAPGFIKYIGTVLPSAIFGFLIIYCIKDVNFMTGSHGAAELISIFAVILLHIWKKNMLLSIASGTCIYMLLVQFVF